MLLTVSPHCGKRRLPTVLLNDYSFDEDPQRQRRNHLAGDVRPRAGRIHRLAQIRIGSGR